MMAQLSRFDTYRVVMIHTRGTDNAIQIIKLSPLCLDSGGHNSEARSKALQVLNNPLQLERVGLAQTGFIRTKPGSPAGPCVHVIQTCFGRPLIGFRCFADKP